MGISIQVDTDDAQVSREQNDFLHYQQRTEPDSDDESDEFEWMFNPDNPVLRAAGIAMNLKTKCDSVLTKIGLRKPRISRDSDSGKCTNCGDMDGGCMTSFLSIEMTAKAQCPSCSILATGIRRFISQKGLLSSSKLIVMDNWNSGCAGRSFIRTKQRSATLPGAMGVVAGISGDMDVKNLFTKFKDVESEIVTEFNLFGTKDDPASWDAVGLAYHISGDTSSEAAFQWFQGRLDHCIREHTLCKAPDESGYLPTRVLDLGPIHDGALEPCADIRLCESGGAHGRYVCLSYCWGGEIDIRLTKDRYPSYTNRIAWSTLPQGYRDAILLTRKLGIRYIWIDSLCIIQDDDADWKMQASLMASIFQNAHVTIAATKSSSPSESYFSTSPKEYKALRVEHEGEDGVLRHAYVRRTIPHFFSSAASTEPNYSPGKSPLLNRGWVFQERLLSPRILHLGDVELAWECNEACACECMGETKTYESEPRWAHTKGAHVRNLAAASDESELQPDWRSTVVGYKKTQLTFQKDVFPAISGVVKNMQRYRSDRYLAGLWEASLLDDLSWGTAGVLRPRPDGWIAPTWSWASVASPISYVNFRTILAREYIQESERRKERTVLIEASITPAGPDATAELLAAHLVLFGPVIPARLVIEDEGTEGTAYWQHGNTRLPLVLDYDIFAPGPGHVPEGSIIYLLHLCREPELKKTGRNRDLSTRVFAVVLRRVEEHDEDRRDAALMSGQPRDGTYERIGISVELMDEEGSEDYVSENGVDCVVKLI